MEERVIALNAGLGAESGRLLFSNNRNCENHVLTEGDGDGSPSVEIDVVTLDKSLNGESPSLMKIDVEGFELAVLRGGEKGTE